MTIRETFSNFARTTLGSTITSSDLTITLSTGASFPVANFYIVLEPNHSANKEIVYVTSRTGNALSVASIAHRGMKGTTALAHTAGVQVSHTPLAHTFNSLSREKIHDKPALNTMDDEFDDDLLTGWTFVDKPAGAALSRVEGNDLVSIYHSGSPVDATSEIHAMLKPLVAPLNTFPVTIETCSRWMTPYAANYRMSGPMFSTTNTWGTGAQLWNMNYTNTAIATSVAASVRPFTNFNTQGTDYGSPSWQWMSPYYYSKLSWTAANTFKFEISPNGVQWINLFGDFVWAQTPQYFGIGDSSWGSATKSIVSYEYIRVY